MLGGCIARDFQGIADVVETLLEDVDSYLDEASGKGANQQVTTLFASVLFLCVLFLKTENWLPKRNRLLVQELSER